MVLSWLAGCNDGFKTDLEDPNMALWSTRSVVGANHVIGTGVPLAGWYDLSLLVGSLKL